MSKYKLYIKGIKEDVNLNRNEVSTVLVEVMDKCKKCGKNDRKHGSSRCEDCSSVNRVLMFEQKRIKDKIEKQGKVDITSNTKE